MLYQLKQIHRSVHGHRRLCNRASARAPYGKERKSCQGLPRGLLPSRPTAVPQCFCLGTGSPRCLRPSAPGRPAARPRCSHPHSALLPACPTQGLCPEICELSVTRYGQACKQGKGNLSLWKRIEQNNFSDLNDCMIL